MTEIGPTKGISATTSRVNVRTAIPRIMPLLKKNLFSLSKFRTSYPSDTTNGNSAIVRALLMATVNSR